MEFSGNVLVDSRLYTPSRPAPTVGMYVPGLSAGEAYAEAVVTSNPGCIIQIVQGLRAKGSPIQVLHIVELLDDPR